MNIPEIILASTSPRRKMLLKQVAIPFISISPDVSEEFPIDGNFRKVVMRNAEAKAQSVVMRLTGNHISADVSNQSRKIILGADTIVDLNGRALGKPCNEDEARWMLHELSGQEHIVHSGIALLDFARDKINCNHVQTSVLFRKLRDGEIDAYIRSGEPMDKAGSYGIQARGALFIERIEGCFFNVMGLPLARLWEMLWEMESVSC